MRGFRLALGILIIGQGIYAKDWFIVIIGGVLTLTALMFKAGCSSGEACYTPFSNSNKTEDISYEEVKNVS